MTIRRLLLVLRHRWWVLVVFALLGATAAGAVAVGRNATLDRSFRAAAPVTVLRLPEESDDAYRSRLATAEAQARSAVADELTGDPTVSVDSDPVLGAVRFIATASTSDEATARATTLRSRFLAAGPAETAGDQLDASLETLAAEIARVEEQRAQLQTGSVDPVVEARRQALQGEIGRLAEEAAGLQVRLADPGLGESDRQVVEAQLADTLATLGTLGDELAGLPGEELSSTRARLEGMVLEQRLRDLEAQYVAAALRRAEASTDTLTAAPFVEDLSEVGVSPVLAALVGLGTGAILGLLLLVVLDRATQPILASDDVDGPPVVEVPHRGRRTPRHAPWYPAATGDPRRTQLQVLRSRLVADLEPGTRLAVVGVDIPPKDVQALAIDLAAGLAASGRPVLALDTHFWAPPPVMEWAGSGDSLAAILTAIEDEVAEGARSVVKNRLWSRSEVLPGLMAVPAGTVSGDPVDLLGGRGFEIVLEEASQLADVVLISLGDVSEPGTHAGVVRTHPVVLAARHGATSAVRVRAAIETMSGSGHRVEAVALVARAARGSARKRGRRSERVHDHRRGRRRAS